MLNSKRMVGDIFFFLYGDEGRLTEDSIYTRIKERDGKLDPTYHEVIQEMPMDLWNFAEHANNNGYNVPCIESIYIQSEDKCFVSFTRVDTEQFSYDMMCIDALLRGKQFTGDISVSITQMKDFKGAINA